MSDIVTPRLRWKGPAIAVLLGVGALALIMGDRFHPWVRTIRKTARDHLETLVDESQYKLSQAEIAVENARKRQSQLGEATQKTEALLRSQEFELTAARTEGADLRTKLDVLRESRRTGESVRLVGGRKLGDDEVGLRLQDYEAKLEINTERVRFLESFVERCRDRRDGLLTAQRQMPQELARLEMSLTHLAQKVKLYEEKKKLLELEKNSEAARQELYQTAQQALQQAHAELDANLNMFQSRFPEQLELEKPPTVGK
jgi:chromosome segregation ATPase